VPWQFRPRHSEEKAPKPLSFEKTKRWYLAGAPSQFGVGTLGSLVAGGVHSALGRIGIVAVFVWLGSFIVVVTSLLSP
jgi:ribosomal protein S3AE